MHALTQRCADRDQTHTHAHTRAHTRAHHLSLSPQGTLDLKEFGWYLADLSTCDDSKTFAEILDGFEEAIDYIMMRKAGGG